MKQSMPISISCRSRSRASLGLLAPRHGYSPARNLPGNTQYELGSGRSGYSADIELLEIELGRVGKMRHFHVAQGREDGFGAAGKVLLPLREHLFHRHALHVVLRAAELAGDDGEVAPPGIALDV